MNPADLPSLSGNAASLAGFPPPEAGRTGWPWTDPDGEDGGDSWGPGGPPSISIVIPSFNQGHFIEETIRSILLQRYPKLELIVMDGGSRDATVSVLQKYDPWISHWESRPDRGQTHAINKGLERSTGEVFAYLNSDDLLAPGALWRVAEAFKANPDADVVYGHCVYIDGGGTELFTVRGRVAGFLDYLRIWDRLARHEFLTQPEVFCRTRSLVEAGGFREELHSVMDFEMWLRLLYRGARFQAIDTPVAKFRLYAGQKSSVDPGAELCSVVEEYLQRAGLPREEDEAIRKELRRARAELLVRAGVTATLLDRYGEGVRFCLEAAARYPRVVALYQFWTVLASPVRGLLPPRLRGALQTLFGVKPA